MLHTRKVWFNIYPNGQSVWPSKEKALEHARSTCLAVGVEATINYVEGQGREPAPVRA